MQMRCTCMSFITCPRIENSVRCKIARHKLGKNSQCYLTRNALLNTNVRYISFFYSLVLLKCAEDSSCWLRKNDAYNTILSSFKTFIFGKKVVALCWFNETCVSILKCRFSPEAWLFLATIKSIRIYSRSYTKKLRTVTVQSCLWLWAWEYWYVIVLIQITSTLQLPNGQPQRKWHRDG